MMTDEQRALIFATTSKRILTALAVGGEPPVEVIICALGTVAGILAAVTERPADFMAQLNAVAQGVIDGNLMKDA